MLKEKRAEEGTGGTGQKKPDGFFVASAASTASCQMMVFQMLEVEGEKREGWKEKTTFLFFSSLFFFFF